VQRARERRRGNRTFKTFPVPAYAHVFNVISAYFPRGCATVRTASKIASACSCFPKYSSPSPRQRKRAEVWASSSSEASISRCVREGVGQGER